MVRAEGARDWSAEQLEAAAAALGAFVASNMKMGGFANQPLLKRPALDRYIAEDLARARAMDAAANQVVYWAAKEAGSYARAAERERERQAEWLAKNHGTVFEVCAWCPPDIREVAERAGRASGLPISHGICPSCLARQLAEIPDPRD